MNSRNPENRRSFIIAPPGWDARAGLCARSAWGVRAGLGARSAWCAIAARDVRAGRGARVSLGAGGTQVNLSAGTAETLEENS